MIPGPTDSSSAFEALLARDRAWAGRHGLELDAAGRLVDPHDALCFEPSPELRSKLAQHPERPLGEAGKPALIGQTAAAWALALDLFEAPTQPVDLAPVLSALGAPGEPTRRGWVHAGDDARAAGPHAPLLRIDRADASPVFVEVLTTELLEPERDDSREFPRPDDGWGDLEGCRRLAGADRSRYAPVRSGRLLHRIRTLSRSHGRRGFRWVTLRASFETGFDDHVRRAFDALRSRVGGEVDFDVLSVDTVLGRMRAGQASHPALEWLGDRFSHAAAPATRR